MSEPTYFKFEKIDNGWSFSSNGVSTSKQLGIMEIHRTRLLYNNLVNEIANMKDINLFNNTKSNKPKTKKGPGRPRKKT